jgi:hypothetical protein
LRGRPGFAKLAPLAAKIERPLDIKRRGAALVATQKSLARE